jgi:hypothetical protein
MPPELFLGAAAVLILLVLFGSLFRGNRAKRRILHKSSQKDDLTNQLTRIADALEAIVGHLRASPPHVVAPPAPSSEKMSEQTAADTTGADQGKAEADESKRHHYVKFSMFGR